MPDPTSQSFDEIDLMDRLEGDAELLGELAKTFNAIHVEQLEGLRRAFAEGNLEQLSRSAHALKGSLMTLAARASVHAAALEQRAKSADRVACEIEVDALTVALPQLARELTAFASRQTV